MLFFIRHFGTFNQLNWHAVYPSFFFFFFFFFYIVLIYQLSVQLNNVDQVYADPVTLNTGLLIDSTLAVEQFPVPSDQTVQSIRCVSLSCSSSIAILRTGQIRLQTALHNTWGH